MEKEQPVRAILLRNTMAYDREHTTEFERAIWNAVLFAEKNAPQLMVQVFIDHEKCLCYSFQLYANSEAVLRHWEVSDPHISEVMRYCVVQSMDVYGTPSESVRNGILEAVGKDKVTFTPGLVGYYHLR